MNFELSDTQQQFQREVRSFFRREWSLDDVRALESNEQGYSHAHWKMIADLGWLQPVAADRSGTPYGMVEAVILAMEMGYCLFPSPLVDVTGVIHCLSGCPDTSDLGAELLAGEREISVGWLEPTVSLDEFGIRSHATLSERGFAVSGSKALVRGADQAHQILWPARTSDDQLALLLIDTGSPGLRITPASAALGDRYFEVTAENVSVSAGRIIEVQGPADRIFEESRYRAAIVICALMAGASARVLEMATTYAQERHQFGKPIGTFQAVQWLCVDMATRAHRLELLAWNAAAAADSGLDYGLEASESLAFAARAMPETMRYAHEVFAGLGFMMAHDLHLFTRRAKGWETSFGQSRLWNERFLSLRGGL